MVILCQVIYGNICIYVVIFNLYWQIVFIMYYDGMENDIVFIDVESVGLDGVCLYMFQCEYFIMMLMMVGGNFFGDIVDFK